MIQLNEGVRQSHARVSRLDVRDGLHDVPVRHIPAWVVVLEYGNNSRVGMPSLVELQKVSRVLGHQYSSVGSSVLEVVKVAVAGQADLRRILDRVASFPKKMQKQMRKGTIIEVQ
jgi:hypothetical protein